MKNLAGKPTDPCNSEVAEELRQANVPSVFVEFKKESLPEVRTNLIGVLHFKCGVTITFSREWYYWSVTATKALPFEKADALNRLMGNEVRVDGFAGGKNVNRHGCSHWHVDSQLGLNVLVHILRKEFGELSPEHMPTVSTMARQDLLNYAIYGDPT